ncbi:uncharacterized protein LOC130123213 isoform X2 [Lampris incognitus]|uniref:uncharacterized protein LOC130123213 isoform X2 n=1 Tax=Lampris incognitus TaxID=2546036 RepID=UPI0024B5B4CA|nr:uncharacterized protein LOC130123213 isoform X2 [Lampris incognitus]
MVESTVTMSVDTSGETAEVEILALESLSEATDALEAEMSLVLESLYYSGPTPTVQSTVQQKPEFPETAGKNRKALGDVGEVLTEKPLSQEEVIQSVIYGGDGREEDGGVLEAMSLESVTLAEVEALLGMLESDTLTETSAQLEIEAEIFAKEVGKGTERTVREDDFASEDKDETTVLTEEALSEADCLSEALEAETEILLEELLFSVPGRVAVEREALTAHKVAMDDILRGREVREHAIGREERGDEGFVANASLSIESLSLSEVEVVVETQGGDILTETITRQETAVRIPPQETQTERDCPQEEQKVFFGAVEDDNLAIAAILTNALEVESAVIPQNQPCPILGPVTMKTVPSGPASTDPAPGEQDTPPAPVSPPLCNMAPPAPKEVLGLSQEEEGAGSAPPAGRKEVDAEGEAEGGRQTSTLGIPEGIDPVQRLFMEKIREYDNKCRAQTGPGLRMIHDDNLSHSFNFPHFPLLYHIHNYPLLTHLRLLFHG